MKTSYPTVSSIRSYLDNVTDFFKAVVGHYSNIIANKESIIPNHISYF